MKKLFILLALSIFLAACAGMGASTGLTEEQEAGIPDGAKAVVLTADVSPDEAYQNIRSAILENGYEIAEENADLRRIITDPKNVGHRMRMHLVVRVVPQRNVSGVNITGKWTFEQTSNAMESTMGGQVRVREAGRDAAWIDNSSSRSAFGRLVLLAESLEGFEVAYE